MAMACGSATAASLLCVIAAMGCGATGSDPYAIHVPPSPSGGTPLQVLPGAPSAAPVAAGPLLPPPGDACAKIPATRGDVPFRDPNPTRSLAGQMTEQAAQAKRLFDGEHWKDAENALKRVADGETGDDEGNKQLADYHRAIALYRLERFEDSAARFRKISRNPGHLKFREVLIWIVKLARIEPKVVRVDDLALYSPEEITYFDNPSQREVFGAASYLVGHERYDEGNLSEAQKLLENAKRVGPWSKEADACLTKIAKSLPPRR